MLSRIESHREAQDREGRVRMFHVSYIHAYVNWREREEEGSSGEVKTQPKPRKSSMRPPFLPTRWVETYLRWNLALHSCTTMRKYLKKGVLQFQMFGVSNEIHSATIAVLMSVHWHSFNMSEQKGRQTVSNETINSPVQTLGDMQAG